METAPTTRIFTIFEGTSPILRTAALGEAAVGAQPCLPPYGAPGVPAAVQAGPCRVLLDPGKAAHWLARAEMYPSCTHDGHGQAEPLTAQVKNAP